MRGLKWALEAQLASEVEAVEVKHVHVFLGGKNSEQSAEFTVAAGNVVAQSNGNYIFDYMDTDKLKMLHWTIAQFFDWCLDCFMHAFLSHIHQAMPQ